MWAEKGRARPLGEPSHLLLELPAVKVARVSVTVPISSEMKLKH
jgi:hypothetical protein